MGEDYVDWSEAEKLLRRLKEARGTRTPTISVKYKMPVCEACNSSVKYRPEIGPKFACDVVHVDQSMAWVISRVRCSSCGVPAVFFITKAGTGTRVEVEFV